MNTTEIKNLKDYEHLIGKQVRKTKKPFKSGEKINTVTGIVVMDELSQIKGRTVFGATFKEDDSVVEVERIKEVK